MLEKIKNLTHKFHSGRDRRNVQSANSSSALPALGSSISTNLLQPFAHSLSYTSDPYQLDERDRVYNGLHRGEAHRNGSPAIYAQSQGELTIANPEATPAALTYSEAPTSSNLSNYDPSPLGDLVTSMHHRTASPQRDAAGSGVSLGSDSSRTSISSIASMTDFCPMNADLTAAVFTMQASGGANEFQDGRRLGGPLPRPSMNPLRLNPPNRPVVTPASRQDLPLLDEQGDVAFAATSLQPPMEPRQSSRLGFYPAIRDEEGIRLSVSSTRSVASRPSSGPELSAQRREKDVTKSEVTSSPDPSSITEPNPQRPLGEYLQTRITQRRRTDIPGPTTTAEFPAVLRAQGPYTRFPAFRRSSGFRYPHDEPFHFSSLDVRASDLDFGTSNLTRPPIPNYRILRRSSSGAHILRAHSGEPDRDIYKRRISLSARPILYLHSRYPRHLPPQLLPRAPFPSTGPVTRPSFRERTAHHLIGVPTRRERRFWRAKPREMTKTLERFRSRRRFERERLGSARVASRGRKTRGSHSWFDDGMRRGARRWGDYTIFEEQVEYSVCGAVVEETDAGGELRADANVPALQHMTAENEDTNASTETPRTTLAPPSTPSPPSTTPVLTRNFHLTELWLQQNNPSPNPNPNDTNSPSQDFINIP